MKEISVFDVIGPNMIGPSSSHTAGALRIALMAGKLASAPVKKAHFILYGSFARTYHGHGTDRALVGGILGFSTEDRRIRDSFAHARAAGVEISFEADTSKETAHPNTVEIILTDENGQVTDVVGESIGGGNARLVRINGVGVDISGELETIVITQKDEPGVIAHVTRCLYDEGINIAFLTVYREERHELAYSVIETDGQLPEVLSGELEKVPYVQHVSVIRSLT